MRIANNAAAESCGLSASRNLTITANAQAFKLLSDTLYSDKITSVLRELGSNAVDSHRAAGRSDLPFEVKLPNSLDTKFYVKDWGVGLDEREVYDVYLSYFSSSKQDSNEFIGGFGLGSKSPFAYTDMFSLVAVKNGVKRTFLVYLDESGPKVSKVAETQADPDWLSGVEVSFAVRPGDFAAFAAKAKATYTWFEVCPVIKGANIVKDDIFEKCQKYATATLFPKRIVELVDDSVYHMYYVRVGGCLYSFSHTDLGMQFSEFLDSVHLSEGFGAEVVGRLLLEAPIGSVALTGSREKLSFDSTGKTKATLISLTQQALQAINQELCAILNDPHTQPMGCLRAFMRKCYQLGASSGRVAGDLVKQGGITQDWLRAALSSHAKRGGVLQEAPECILQAVAVRAAKNKKGAYASWSETTSEALDSFMPTHELYMGTEPPVGKLREALRQLCLESKRNLLYVQVTSESPVELSEYFGGLQGNQVPLSLGSGRVAPKRKAVKASTEVDIEEQVASVLLALKLSPIANKAKVLKAEDFLDMTKPPVLVIVASEQTSVSTPVLDLADVRFMPSPANLKKSAPLAIGAWEQDQIYAGFREILPKHDIVHVSRSEANQLLRLIKLVGGLDKFNIKTVAEGLVKVLRQTTPLGLGWYARPPETVLAPEWFVQLASTRGRTNAIIQYASINFEAKAVFEAMLKPKTKEELIYKWVVEQYDFRFEDFSENAQHSWRCIASAITKAPFLLTAFPSRAVGDFERATIDAYIRSSGIV